MPSIDAEWEKLKDEMKLKEEKQQKDESSQNRSNSKAFCHILPCIASVYEGMHYHKTGVPWQMNRIFIIVV